MTSHDAHATIGDAIGATNDPVYNNRFRAKRIAAFLGLVDAVLARKGSCRVLDLGGEVAYWQGLRDQWRGRRLEITMINTSVEEASVSGPFTVQPGDARRLPEFADDSFDIVHSNSVIEHVGTWFDMQAMANEVRRIAPSYFVQTPNYWFPYEPHLRVPFIHWMPRPWRRRIVMARACGFYPKAATVEAAHRILADATLIDAPAMAALFPDARLVREHVGPLTKSLIAVRATRV